jgi:hypothetical protein
MERIGTITFQSNDKADVFYVTDVYEQGTEPSDESFMGTLPIDFEDYAAWVTGKVPTMKPVHVEGDTTIVHGWFKGGFPDRSYRLTIYVEYELAEEVITDDEHALQKENTDSSLEPQEINL